MCCGPSDQTNDIFPLKTDHLVRRTTEQVWPWISGGSRISRWGGANLWHIHFSAKTYAKTKEIDPGEGRRRRPPGSANALNISVLEVTYFKKKCYGSFRKYSVRRKFPITNNPVIIAVQQTYGRLAVTWHRLVVLHNDCGMYIPLSDDKHQFVRDNSKKGTGNLRQIQSKTKLSPRK